GVQRFPVHQVRHGGRRRRRQDLHAHLLHQQQVPHRQEDYNRLRPLSYRGADVFVLAFSLVSRASYENIMKKWIPELQHYAPGVPVVLVGTKLDLREDKHYLLDHPGMIPVTTAQGEELRKQVGALYYIECSSKTQQVKFSVRELYALAAAIVSSSKCLCKLKILTLVQYAECQSCV
ncbi:hypothetical protein CFC21_084503, partial [Triticum aestivum]